MNIFIKTFGCSLNQSDSEAMAGILKNKGYTLVDNEEEADLVIVNSCTVKNLAEKKFFKEIETAKKLGKKIVLAGCVPQADPHLVETKLKEYSVVGVNHLDKISTIVYETFHGKTIQHISKEKNQRLNIPVMRKNKVIHILPISEGCLSNCSFCKTKLARGDLRSYGILDIKQEIKKALHDGCKEIWLTSQDTGCYGLDIGLNLPVLLEECIQIPGDFKIRLGMLNPNYTKIFLSKLIRVFKHEKMFKFLHIPVQSGNNRVLRAMKRSYTIEDFKNIVKTFREEIPDISISTDLIVGFPGETEEEFLDSYTLIKEVQPEFLNFSRYWKGEGTAAAKLIQIHGGVSKERSAKIKELYDTIQFQNNKKWLGWKGEILIDEYGNHNKMIGRNFAYKQVLVDSSYGLGETVQVTVENISQFDLRASHNHQKMVLIKN